MLSPIKLKWQKCQQAVAYLQIQQVSQSMPQPGQLCLCTVISPPATRYPRTFPRVPGHLIVPCPPAHLLLIPVFIYIFWLISPCPL